MLVAKLSKEILIPVAISPLKTENRRADSFFVIPLNYQLGSPQCNFFIKLTEEKVVPRNPASEVEGEGETTTIYETKKVFNVALTADEMKEWGDNDESLLKIFAKKFDLSIDSFVMVEEVHQ